MPLGRHGIALGDKRLCIVLSEADFRLTKHVSRQRELVLNKLSYEFSVSAVVVFRLQCLKYPIPCAKGLFLRFAYCTPDVVQHRLREI